MLLTGATGFVGMEVLARYLERGERPLVALVRAPGDAAGAGARSTGCSQNLFGAGAAGYAPGSRRDAAELTAPGPRPGPRRARRARRARRHDRPQRCLGVVLAAARRGPGDQPRGDPADARVRRAALASRAACALRPRVHGVRRRDARRAVCRVRPGPRAGLPQLLRASKFEAEQLVRAAGVAVHDPTAEHRRRRPPQRLDFGLQRPLLAAAGVRARPVHRGPGDPQLAGRCRLGRLRRRCDLRAVRVTRRRGGDLSPDRRCRTPARSARSPVWPAGISAGRCRGCSPRGVRRADPERDGQARRSTPAGCTSPTSRSGPCSTTPPPALASSRWGSARPRCGTTSSGCWTSPPAAVGATADRPDARATLGRERWSESPPAGRPPTRGVRRRCGCRPPAERGWSTVTVLADVARFRPDDPDRAGRGQPLGLSGVPAQRGHRMVGRPCEGYDPSVQCRCPNCDERWLVYLAPEQALRSG